MNIYFDRIFYTKFDACANVCWEKSVERGEYAKLMFHSMFALDYPLFAMRHYSGIFSEKHQRLRMISYVSVSYQEKHDQLDHIHSVTKSSPHFITNFHFLPSFSYQNKYFQ